MLLRTSNDYVHYMRGQTQVRRSQRGQASPHCVNIHGSHRLIVILHSCRHAVCLLQMRSRPSHASRAACASSSRWRAAQRRPLWCPSRGQPSGATFSAPDGLHRGRCRASGKPVDRAGSADRPVAARRAADEGTPGRRRCCFRRLRGGLHHVVRRRRATTGQRRV